MPTSSAPEVRRAQSRSVTTSGPYQSSSSILSTTSPDAARAAASSTSPKRVVGGHRPHHDAAGPPGAPATQRRVGRRSRAGPAPAPRPAPACLATWVRAKASCSGRRVASRMLTDGSPTARTPARAARRVRQASVEWAAAAARRSRTLCSSRRSRSSRSTSVSSRAASDGSSPTGAAPTRGTPARASAATSYAVARGTDAHGPGVAQPGHGHVGDPTGRQVHEAAGPVPAEAGRREDPFVDGLRTRLPLGHQHRRATGDRMDLLLLRPADDHVGRHLRVRPGVAAHHQAAAPDDAARAGVPRELGEDLVHRGGRVEAEPAHRAALGAWRARRPPPGPATRGGPRAPPRAVVLPTHATTARARPTGGGAAPARRRAARSGTASTTAPQRRSARSAGTGSPRRRISTTSTAGGDGTAGSRSTRVGRAARSSNRGSDTDSSSAVPRAGASLRHRRSAPGGAGGVVDDAAHRRVTGCRGTHRERGARWPSGVDAQCGRAGC